MLYMMLDGSMKLSKPAMWSVRPYNPRTHSSLTSLKKGRYAVLNRWLNGSEITFRGEIHERKVPFLDVDIQIAPREDRWQE